MKVNADYKTPNEQVRAALLANPAIVAEIFRNAGNNTEPMVVYKNLMGYDGIPLLFMLYGPDVFFHALIEEAQIVYGNCQEETNRLLELDQPLMDSIKQNLHSDLASATNQKLMQSSAFHRLVARYGIELSLLCLFITAWDEEHSQ